MSKQKWTKEDTQNAIDWSIKMDQTIINHAKIKFVDLTNALEADSTNLDLQQAVSAQQAKIIKLETRLARFIAHAPELLGAY
jgi:uncharacterized protein involved in outer membrane biogenesis